VIKLAKERVPRPKKVILRKLMNQLFNKKVNIKEIKNKTDRKALTWLLNNKYAKLTIAENEIFVEFTEYGYHLFGVLLIEDKSNIIPSIPYNPRLNSTEKFKELKEKHPEWTTRSLVHVIDAFDRSEWDGTRAEVLHGTKCSKCGKELGSHYFNIKRMSFDCPSERK